MSETLMKVIVNCETGVISEIPLTDEEIRSEEHTSELQSH